ncbi:MAG TPA: hypothetical protein VL986_12355 [Terracidiphilus sp.]|nr:hypothetical protein [Terracidiphilus sp.]
MRGLSIHTLDVWRRRVAQCAADEKIVPVEIVADCVASKDRMLAASVTRSCQFRIVLAQGISIEVEPGFDAGELRRLVAALDDLAQRPEFRQLSTLLTSRSFVRVQSQGLVSRNQRLESLGGLARELRYA